MGERAQPTPYKIAMAVNQSCHNLCKKSYNTNDVDLFSKHILEWYFAHFDVDNLPVVVHGVNDHDEEIFFSEYPIGRKSSDGRYCIYNDLEFTIKYRRPMRSHTLSSGLHNDVFHVVGFQYKSFDDNKTVENDSLSFTCDFNKSIDPI